MCVVTKVTGLAGRWAGRGSRLGRARGLQQTRSRHWGAHAGTRADVQAARVLGRQARGREWACRRERARGRGRMGRRQVRRGAQSAGGQTAARAAGVAGVGARGARRGRACVRRLGVLAGSVGPSCCTVHLAQF